MYQANLALIKLPPILKGFDNAFKTECEDEVDDEELTIYECLCCGEIVNEVDDLVRHHKTHVNHPNCEYLKVGHHVLSCPMKISL